MSLPQRKYREIVLQLLYSLEIQNASADSPSLIDFIAQELKVAKSHLKQALTTAQEIYAKREDLDVQLSSAVKDYSFERIQLTEKNILRLSLYEMQLPTPTPPAIAISEAIRLAKKFGNLESASFINAVLDQVTKNAHPEK